MVTINSQQYLSKYNFHLFNYCKTGSVALLKVNMTQLYYNYKIKTPFFMTFNFSDSLFVFYFVLFIKKGRIQKWITHKCKGYNPNISRCRFKRRYYGHLAKIHIKASAIIKVSYKACQYFRPCVNKKTWTPHHAAHEKQVGCILTLKHVCQPAIVFRNNQDSVITSILPDNKPQNVISLPLCRLSLL